MNTMRPRAKRWIKYLIAIIVGNVIYFSLESHFPPAAQHHPYHIDLGLFIDLWFCVAIYGLLELFGMLMKRFRH